MPANADPSRKHLNESWEHDRIKNLASTRSLLRRAEKLYIEKQGQKWQKSTAPLKETCVVCKESTTLEDAMKIVRKVEDKTGAVCLGVWIHKDEGHARSRFNPNKPYQCNYHIHILWDCQNPETGKMIRMNKQDMRDMQDISADSLGMERGTPAEETGRSHIDSLNFKVQKLEEEAEEFEKEVTELKKEVEELRKERTGLLAKIQDAWQWKPKAKQLEADLKAEKEAHNQAITELNKEHGKTVKKLNNKIQDLTKEVQDKEWWVDYHRKERDVAEKDNKLLKSKIDRLKNKVDELTRGKEQEQSRGRGR